MAWGDIAAIALAAIAGLRASYLTAILIEKLSEPPHWPPTSRDPYIVGLLRGWDAGETIRRGGDRAGQRPSVTHTNKPVISHHDEKRPTP
jgi:hypothetical protein